MALERIVQWFNRKKPTIDSKLDPLLLRVAANLGYIGGLDFALEQVSKNTEQYEGPAILGTYLAAAALFYPFNKYLVGPINRKIKRVHEERRARGVTGNKTSWIRSLAALGAFSIFFSPMYKTSLDNIRWDGTRVVEAFSREGVTEVPPEVLEERPETLPRALQRARPRNVSEQEIADSNRYSDRGRFLRAYRWNNVFRAEESRNRLEEGLLGSIAMHESMGDPLAIGPTGDAGLMQLHPKTARSYGLNILDGRGARPDRNYSTKLISLARQNGWDYETLSRIDERFDVKKSVGAAARLLADNIQRCRSVDGAILAYNKGSCGGRNPGREGYVQSVRRMQGYYIQHSSQRARSAVRPFRIRRAR